MTLTKLQKSFAGPYKMSILIGGVGADPEFKPWIEAVNVIFRFQEHEPLPWDRLTSAVIDGVRHIAAVTDRGKPDARLSELMATLMEKAKLPAEREIDQRFEEEQARANRDVGDREEYEEWERSRQKRFLIGVPKKDPDGTMRVTATRPSGLRKERGGGESVEVTFHHRPGSRKTCPRIGGRSQRRRQDSEGIFRCS